MVREFKNDNGITDKRNKYMPYIFGNGRVVLVENKTIDEAINLDKEILIICNAWSGGYAHAVGAEKAIDPDFGECWNMYGYDIKDKELDAVDLDKFYRVIISSGEQIWMESGEQADTYIGSTFIDWSSSLKRICGIDGNVWEYTLRELQKMKLADSEQTIPTFEEALQVIGGKVPVIVEYKMDRADTKVCELGNRILEGYKGTYCIESFHPLAVRWYRKNRPDVIRGQLSENFAKRGNKNPAVWIMIFLLLNFLARPDFIAYRHEDAENISRRICRRLGALSVAWTIKSQEQYEKAKPKFDLFIFDSFTLK